MRHLLPLLVLLLLPQCLLAQPAVDSFIATHAAEHDFNGTILVQKRGEVSYFVAKIGKKVVQEAGAPNIQPGG